MEYNTLNYDVMRRIKSKNQGQQNKAKTLGSDVGFESKVDRFKEWTKPLYQIELGPGKYTLDGDFDEKVCEKKRNLLYCKTVRFAIDKTSLRFSKIAHYQPRDELNKPSYNVIFKGI